MHAHTGFLPSLVAIGGILAVKRQLNVGYAGGDLELGVVGPFV